MNSGKTLVILTMLFVLMLLAGSVYFPNTTLMSLADTSLTYTTIRGGIIVMLISILVTKPPRALALRGMLGSWALLLALRAIDALLSYEMHVLDSVVFMEVAIILAIEALEKQPLPAIKKPTPARRIPVVSA